MRGKKLTERQRRFVDEYILDGNATQAAIRAGFKENSAEVQGPRLLGNVRVALEIRRRRASIAKRMEVSAERVIEYYARIAFTDRKLPLKTSDQLNALNALGKHLGLFVEKHDITMRMVDGLSQIKARLSPAAQEEFVRAVGLELEEGETDLASAGEPPAGESSG